MFIYKVKLYPTVNWVFGLWKRETFLLTLSGLHIKLGGLVYEDILIHYLYTA